MSYSQTMVLTMSCWLYFPPSLCLSITHQHPLVFHMDTNTVHPCLSVLWFGPEATIFPLIFGVGNNMLLLTILSMVY